MKVLEETSPDNYFSEMYYIETPDGLWGPFLDPENGIEYVEEHRE